MGYMYTNSNADTPVKIDTDRLVIARSKYKERRRVVKGRL
jgi:hypothetical protein